MLPETEDVLRGVGKVFLHILIILMAVLTVYGFITSNTFSGVKAQDYGLDWEIRRNPNTTFNNIAKGVNWNSGNFVTIGTVYSGAIMTGIYGNILISGDGYVWDAQLMHSNLYDRYTSHSLNSVIFGEVPSRWVAVGDLGRALSVANDDLGDKNWTLHSTPTDKNLHDLVVHKFQINSLPASQFIAIGDGTILRSFGGEIWEAIDLNPNYLNSSMYGVTKYNTTHSGLGGKLMIVGEKNGNAFVGSVNLPSDGVLFNTGNSVEFTNVDPLYGIASGVTPEGFIIVAVGGNGRIQTNTTGDPSAPDPFNDPIPWTVRSSFTNETLRDVTWTGKVFVAVGDNGTILTSPDGKNWTKNSSGTTRDLHSVTASDNEIIVVGEDHIVLGAEQPVIFTITASANPSEYGTVTGGGDYVYGHRAFINAKPNIGYCFVDWDEYYKMTGWQHLTDNYNFSFKVERYRVLRANFDHRLAGNNRYTTAVEICKSGWHNTTGGKVFIARGDDFPDALTGVPLAYHLDAPILLTRTDKIADTTVEKIAKLKPSEIIILGGPPAVSIEVEDFLKNSFSSASVRRIAGDNRWETAVEIASELAGKVQFNTAFIATGTNFPDALAAGSYAALGSGDLNSPCPILLTRPDRLVNATEQAIKDLNINNVIILGSPDAVSKEVEVKLEEMHINVIRIGGGNRFETAVMLAEEFLPKTKHIFIATGMNFPDALSGAVLAAKAESGVLLVRGDRNEPPQEVQDFYTDHKFENISIFGGPPAVSVKMEEWFLNN